MTDGKAGLILHINEFERKLMNFSTDAWPAQYTNATKVAAVVATVHLGFYIF